jgi:CRP/FNR family cyclic AMP-dependent transcriptional regulator
MSSLAFVAEGAARFRQPVATGIATRQTSGSATRGNAILAELGEAAATQIRQQSRQVRFAARTSLQPPDLRPDVVLFPDSGLIAIQVLGSDGAVSEVGTVGAEAAVGLLEALSGAPCPFTHFTLAPTAGWLTPADVVRKAFQADERAADVMWQNVAQVQTRTRNDIACATRHRGLERLADRLLAYRQQLGERLPVTQDDLAQALGMTRTSVTGLVTTLSHAGLTRTGRGWIQIIDADRLGDVACGCRQPPRA